MPPKGSKGSYYGKGQKGGSLKEILSSKDAPTRHNREFVFTKRPEANAFKQGVELVNDSSIRVVEIIRMGTKFVALVQDDDYHFEEPDGS